MGKFLDFFITHHFLLKPAVATFWQMFEIIWATLEFQCQVTLCAIYLVIEHLKSIRQCHFTTDLDLVTISTFGVRVDYEYLIRPLSLSLQATAFSLSLSFSLSRYVTTRGQLSQFGQPAECQMAQLRLRHDAVIAFSQNGDDLRLND